MSTYNRCADNPRLRNPQEDWTPRVLADLSDALPVDGDATK
jgi:hypothetical protein